ncbi:MAG: rod shape-determining protein MreC [Solirubrobacterales bacterium]|nr:rod shape-determining protein MreC [Solirubrobacterales bacterium]
MHDKTVRRRRAVLGLLVVAALILLTASFGSAGGGLSAFQRGAAEVLAPIQEGASRALKPVRDLFGWVGETVDARGENEELRAQLRDARRDAAQFESAAAQNGELRALLGFSEAYGLDAWEPVSARVVNRSPTVWSSSVNVNAGTDDGVREGDAVIGAASEGDGGALVGTVVEATGSTAKVRLVTDQVSEVSSVVARTREPGVIKTASAGNPRDLLLDFIEADDAVEEGMRVVTAGTTDEQYPSLFPPNVPIGEITRIEDPGSETQEIHLEPYADLRRLEFVRILTRAAATGSGGEVAADAGDQG